MARALLFEPKMRYSLKWLFALLVIFAAWPRGASAQVGLPPPLEQTPAKSSGLALALSIAAPVTGYSMILASVLPSGNIQAWQEVAMFTGAGVALIGPSTGHFYTGHVGRGLAFTGGRVLLAILGSMALAEGMDHEDVSEADYDKGAVKTSMIEVALCGAGILALSAWESVDTYRSAEALNRASRRSLAVAPLLASSRAGLSLAGIALTGRY